VNTYQESLAEGIRATHDCDCSFLRTVSVKEQNEGETVWEGQVEVFELEGHSEATEAYAWGWEDDKGEVQCVAVINKPPIDSPREAVQAAISSGQFL